MIVRGATVDDLTAIVDIYNETILTTTGAWTESPDTPDDRRAWFERRTTAGFPVLVADDGGVVVGATSFGDFRDTARWPGYRYTVEHSVHVRQSHWGGGVGRLLMHELFDRAREQQVHVMVGGIDANNTASIAFHNRLGFVEVARMPETGRKFGQWLDLVLMQRFIDPPGSGR